MRRALPHTLLALAVLAMAGWVATHLHIRTDITNFMPVGSSSDLAVLSGYLADSELTRTMVISVGAPRPEQARAAARELAHALEGDPEVAWIRTGIASERMRDLFDLYFPRRYYFLSADPERDVPSLVGEAALRAQAREARLRLAQPSSTLLEGLIARDPIGAFERVLARFRDSQPAVRIEQGQFVSEDGRYALLLLGTRHSAFDAASQGRLLDAIDARFAALAARQPGLVMEQSGANRFAVHAERSIRRDVYRMVALSSAGILVLFLVFVGSLRSFVLISLPTAAGIVIAAFAGLLVFGGLDGLTMAFGATLMGVAIDYPVHLVIHQAAAAGSRAAATARRLRPTLLLGAATTIASFAGLGITAFPAFRQMAFFAIVGVAASVALTLTALPALVERLRPVPPRSAVLASSLSRRLSGLERRGALLWTLPLLALALAPLALPRLHWVDDLARVSSFEPALRAEDARVRERLSHFETSRLVIGLADDRAGAVALDEQIWRRLQRPIAEGQLEGTRSIHALLWSESLQRRNRAALLREPDLVARVEKAYAAEGFRPGALRPFAQELAAPPPPPLRLADLEASPLRDLVSTLIVPLGSRIGALTYLRGVRDPGAVAAALAGLPDVHLFDQRTFVDQIYGEFRQATLRQMLVGSALVVLALLLRYRALRPAFAAFLPCAVVALVLLEAFAALGVDVNLFHVMSLVMVMGMGVDYGVFLVDSARGGGDLGATLLSLVVASLTTVFVFGALALSEQPALRAIGVTTGVGILLSAIVAPLSLAAALPARRR